MSSYIVLTLDTTSPYIDIYAPEYTTPDITNVITVKSDEPLSDFQEIYALDINNVRYDYTFTKNARGDEFTGRIKFDSQPIGDIRLFATVKDEVDNVSNIATATINLKDSVPLLRIEEAHWNMRLNSELNVRRLKFTESTMRKDITIDGR